MKIRPTRFPLGSSYYPPAHDPEDWERDLMAMRAAGLNMIRTAELITSWDYIEPRRGQPEWDWLDRTFELAEKHDFDIVLGTGSCNPPIWMLEPYPDLQRISREGVPYPTNTVAGWACVNNPGLRRELRRYLTLLLERYDDMPALYCWQLDNQIGHNSAFSGAEHAQPRRYGYCCYCDHCAEAFRTWLEAKYGDIDALNHAWTWDPTHYRCYGWHQLQPPRSMPAEWGNGTAWLDFRRFVHDSLNRDAQFSMRTALLPLAGFVGSLIGGWLPGLLADARGLSPAAVGPYRDALLLAAPLYLPALLAMLRAGEAERKTPDRDTPDRDQKPRNLSRAIPYGIILPLVVVDMMRLSAEVGLLGFFNVYLDTGLGAGTSRIGLIVGVAPLIAGGAALATPRASRRLGHRLTIMISMVGMALFLLPLALPQTLLAAVIGYTGAMVLSSMAASSLSVFRMERVGAALWGLMAGAAATGQGVGEATVLFAGGFIITGAGFPAYFLTVAAVALVGALCLWLLVPKDPAPKSKPLEQPRKEID